MILQEQLGLGVSDQPFNKEQIGVWRAASCDLWSRGTPAES